MIATRSVVAALVAALTLGGCGGGGSSSAPVAPANTPPTPAGNASVTIKYPANFKLVQVSKSASAKRAAASSRAPQYVSPAGYQIVVTVNNYCENNGCNSYTSAPMSFSVSPSPVDGTQTLTIPMFGGQNQITATEEDITGTIVDATGSGNFTFSGNGSSQNFVLQMTMNATQLAVTTDPSFTNDPGQILSQNSGSPSTESLYCSNALYFFPADPSGGVVGVTNGVAGVGGIPPVTLVSQFSANAGTSTLVPLALVAGGYSASFDSSQDAINAAVSVTSPYNLSTYTGYVTVTFGCCC